MSVSPQEEAAHQLRRSRLVRVPDGAGLARSRRRSTAISTPRRTTSRSSSGGERSPAPTSPLPPGRPGRMSSTSTSTATAAATRRGTPEAGRAGRRASGDHPHAVRRDARVLQGARSSATAACPDTLIDFRGTGGYVVTAPSKDASGRPYAVVSKQPSAATFDWSAAREHLDPQREQQPQRGPQRHSRRRPGTSATWPPGSQPSRRATATRACSGPRTAPSRRATPPP